MPTEGEARFYTGVSLRTLLALMKETNDGPGGVKLGVVRETLASRCPSVPEGFSARASALISLKNQFI